MPLKPMEPIPFSQNQLLADCLAINLNGILILTTSNHDLEIIRFHGTKEIRTLFFHLVCLR